MDKNAPMRHPRHLHPGDRVALLCPASPPPAEKFEPSLAFVRSLKLEPVPMHSAHYENHHGYFADTDRQRADDLNQAFADDTIDGILCMRGGYGSHRLMPLLNLDEITHHPKYFSGYSDVTALHTVFNQICRFSTWHTVMPSTECADGTLDAWSLAQLKRALFGPTAGLIANPEGIPTKTLVSGTAQGPLCGGNLSLLAAGMGTPWQIDARGKILFLEDIGERYYRLDSMLTQLRNGGVFEDCAGVVLGYWTDCVAEYPNQSLTLEQVFEELIVPAGKPVLSGLCCGHARPCASLPLGAEARLNAGAGILEII